ncbi:MAG: hypothetical protein U5R06_13605 [candidate division KSB1 bacterium]|nr:hypothetical protein [candidate division KSB1 bacterium]
MKIFFSEYKSDYDHYIFPYAVWATLDDGESPAAAFSRGFLPNSHQLDRFYMCRHVRVPLNGFAPSSENRRVLRKGDGVQYTMLPRDEFEFTPEWRRFCKQYADRKFGEEIMSDDRLDSLFGSPVCSHVMRYRDRESQQDIGLVVLYLQPPDAAFYYYAFYDLDYHQKNLGMYMMTSTIQHMHNQGCNYIYLGSCYHRRALYKTQFSGVQFWTGVRWSDNLDELKYLIKREQEPVTQHLLENDEYRQQFGPEGLKESLFGC